MAKIKNKNQNTRGRPVLIYDEITSIDAVKSSAPHRRLNGSYVHTFSRSTPAKIYGLNDGSLLIRGTKPLWKKFSYKRSEL